MVTHEIVTQIDSKNPSSLSYKLVTGILRNELGFQGVIMTDSLTMEGITAYYSEAQAAALAVEAGSDLLMGAPSHRHVGNMIDGSKHAINNGSISMHLIDDSFRRYVCPTLIGFLSRTWHRALLFATLPAWVGLGAFLVAATFKVGAFYLVSPDHVTANVSVLELFAALGTIGWLSRSIFKAK